MIEIFGLIVIVLSLSVAIYFRLKFVRRNDIVISNFEDSVLRWIGYSIFSLLILIGIAMYVIFIKKA